MKQAFAGIDIGGTKIAVGLSTPDGELVALAQLPTESGSGPHAAFDRLANGLESMLNEHEYELASIGVGSPAPIDVRRGMIMSPSNLLDWDEFPIVDLLKRRFGVPVAFDNDANAAALGEFISGAGRGCRHIFYVTVSTGIGGGVIIDGKIYHGVATAAGEIGHTVVQPDGVLCNCGSVGCLETICSGLSIARRAKERIAGGEKSVITEMVRSINEISAENVVEAARRGDVLANEVWEETCRYLALGIGNAISLLAPEVVIVGGGVAAAGELLFAPLREKVLQFVSMVPPSEIRIVPAELGTDSGVHGAMAMARKLVEMPQITYVG